MSEHTTLIINWKGPYSSDDITDNPELGNGLYLAAGKQKYERGNNSIQYCGITEGNFSSRFRNHHNTNSHLLQENGNFGWERWLCLQMRVVIILK